MSLLVLAGLVGSVAISDRGAADDLAAYRVTDRDASFFAVGPGTGLAPAASPVVDPCPAGSLARPLEHAITIPAFYQDRDGWRRASQPFFAFEAQTTGFAADYVRSRAPKYARCLIDLLSSWAERRSLLAYDYRANHGQAWFTVQWSAAAAGLAYSIVRAEPSLSAVRKRQVEAWLATVTARQIAFPGTDVTCCNNHLYWRGLEAAIVGVIAGDDRLFRFGIGAYRSALASMNADGSLPREMARGARALHYQNFAILPLVFIAEIAARQGYDLYGLRIAGRDLHLAVGFLLRALDNPAALRPYGAGPQDLAFVERRDELNWLEPYHRRFPGPETARWLGRLRPLSHTWTGGPASLYFAGLGPAPPDPPIEPVARAAPGEALLSARD